MVKPKHQSQCVWEYKGTESRDKGLHFHTRNTNKSHKRREKNKTAWLALLQRASSLKEAKAALCRFCLVDADSFVLCCGWVHQHHGMWLSPPASYLLWLCISCQVRAVHAACLSLLQAAAYCFTCGGCWEPWNWTRPSELTVKTAENTWCIPNTPDIFINCVSLTLYSPAWITETHRSAPTSTTVSRAQLPISARQKTK